MSELNRLQKHSDNPACTENPRSAESLLKSGEQWYCTYYIHTQKRSMLRADGILQPRVATNTALETPAVSINTPTQSTTIASQLQNAVLTAGQDLSAAVVVVAGCGCFSVVDQGWWHLSAAFGDVSMQEGGRLGWGGRGGGMGGGGAVGC